MPCSLLLIAPFLHVDSLHLIETAVLATRSLLLLVMLMTHAFGFNLVSFFGVFNFFSFFFFYKVHAL